MSYQVTEFPTITGTDEETGRIVKHKANQYGAVSNINWGNTQAAFGIALHMHQPSIPASNGDIRSANLISNLQYMLEHQGEGDNHNASVFLWCYSRISDLVRNHVGAGRNPRVMLDYSGNLLWGLKQMGQGGVLDNLRLVTSNPDYYRNVEWLGTMWSHAVVTSTPIPDVRLHMTAWRHHFASIFGEEACQRVRGFSPPEMHLPIHPDVCFEYVRSLKACGYDWVMIQEHSVENPDGTGLRNQYVPHRLVARNSEGEVAEIACLIKTQGSDTKLVAQMQPYYQAKSMGRVEFAGKSIPPYVCQIGDGENGGVMMNEFVPCYDQAFAQIGTEGVVAMNGSEYLDLVAKHGVKPSDFVPVQPIAQKRIWDTIAGKFAPGAADRAIADIKKQDPNYNLDRGSWTADRSWVKGYEDILDPINKLSVAFHEKYDDPGVKKTTEKYRQALLHLLVSQTSCFRYWGTGVWTEYAKEICRRGMEALQ